MTYQPLAENDGTSYFENIGLLGGTTGMIPILSEPTVLTSPDGYTTATTITHEDSMVSQSPVGNDWINWNFLDHAITSYSKVLVLGYGIGDWFGIAVSENAYTGATAGGYYHEWYMWMSYTGRLTVETGGAQTIFATDAQTPLNNNSTENSLLGIGIYLEGTNNIQKTFFKSEGQWFQNLDTTNADVGAAGYKSMGYYGFAGVGKRVVAPLMAWGVV